MLFAIVVVSFLFVMTGGIVILSPFSGLRVFERRFNKDQIGCLSMAIGFVGFCVVPVTLGITAIF